MKRLPIFIFFVFLFLIPACVFAGPDPCDDPTVLNCDCTPYAEGCPIDGGLSLLIATGIGLGAKKAYKERKKLALTLP